MGAEGVLARHGPPRLLLDLTDLLHHHQRTRVPTGIQRVQGRVTQALLADPPLRDSAAPHGVRLVCYVPDLLGWVDVPEPLFAALMAATEGRAPADWPDLAERIGRLLASTSAARLPDGAVLLNLGSAWWLPNYMLAVRFAAAARGLRYVAFVHDCLPLLRPDLCAPGLPAEFLGWLAGAGLAADGLLASTDFTIGQVRAALEAIGIEPPPAAAVPLDALHQRPTAISHAARAGVPEHPYVLFVSTFEPRKEHALAFRAWLELMARHDAAGVPRLVCVGGAGRQNQAAYALFAAEPGLAAHVTFLSDLDDAGVAALYQGCTCTLYPSVMEGWGLPVTESLGFGKVPVVARTVGVEEAAGAFGEYFTPGSLLGLVAALERVCFDHAYRAAAEARIAAAFRPRSWADLAHDLAGRARAMASGPRRPPSHRLGATAAPERYFAFGRNLSESPGPEVALGEHLRHGAGWLAPMPEGCPTRRGAAQFVLPGPRDGRPATLAVCLLNGADIPLRVDIEAGGRSVSQTLEPGQTQWAGLAVSPSPTAGPDLPVTLRSADANGRPSHQPSGNDALRPPQGVVAVGAMLCEKAGARDCLRRAAEVRAAQGMRSAAKVRRDIRG